MHSAERLLPEGTPCDSVILTRRLYGRPYMLGVCYRFFRRRHMPEKLSKVKVTIRLPETLWKKTRIRALEEGRNAQDIIEDGLELYFSKRGKPPARTPGA